MEPRHLTPIQQRNRRTLRVLAMLFGFGVAIFGTEIVLRIWRNHVGQSDQMEPGMIQREPKAGWKLSAGWKGTHQHHDFSVAYSVDSSGRRFDPTVQNGASNWVATVGDSFTFGLGVEDAETFTALLNRQESSRFLNFGIPGFSTDQELILIENEILPRHPPEIILVVYLGNDLFDNLRFVPLQVGAPKPRFEIQNDQLVLMQPEAEGTVSSNPAGVDPAAAVLNPISRYRWRQKLEQSSLVFGFASRSLPAPDLTDEFSVQFQPALALFSKLMSRLRDRCRENGTTLRVALLGSSAFINQPRSVSGQYQEYLQREIRQIAREQSVALIDLAEEMRQLRASGVSSRGWYHPNEGHLTPEGHQVVADLLAKALKVN